jgi:predicted TIM-barrel fold metal-dependent hydrolase
MIVDTNAYVGHWPFRQLRGNTCRELLQRMDEYGVDLSLVSNLNGIFYRNTQSANEELDRELKASGKKAARLIPFATLNPTYPDWRRDLETCRDRFGIRGLRLYPQYHDYGFDHPELVELVKKARDLRMPLAFSIRLEDQRQRSWLDLQKLRMEPGVYDDQLKLSDFRPLIEAVPDARFMVLQANIGAEDAATQEILKKTDVVFDTVRGSGVPVTGPNGYDIAGAIGKYGKEKLAFGTCTPFMDYCSPFVRIHVLKESDEVKKLIWSGNAMRMLGLI